MLFIILLCIPLGIFVLELLLAWALRKVPWKEMYKPSILGTIIYCTSWVLVLLWLGLTAALFGGVLGGFELGFDSVMGMLIVLTVAICALRELWKIKRKRDNAKQQEE